MGNRTTGPELADTYAYGTDNRLLSASFDEYSGMDESWTYGYDYENRLTSVVKLSGDDTLTTTYKYDPFGRRIEKHVEGTVGGVSVNKTFTYVYDNEDVILEYLTGTEGGNPVDRTTRYVHGPGIDEPLSMDRAGVVYYYHADGLGSIVALTDANETIAESYAYTPFGGVESTGNVDNPYTYTGREWDPEAGLYYYRARYYDPEVGRFIGKDPIGFAAGDVNLYGYVGQNATNFVDPSGLTAAAGPVPIPLPPVFLPGTPENDQFVNAVKHVFNSLPDFLTKLVLLNEIYKNSNDKPDFPLNPEDTPDEFKNVKNRPGRECSDGSYWEKDFAGHGGSKWKRWPSIKDKEKGRKPDSVRDKGRKRK